jgi:hypothetical protein
MQFGLEIAVGAADGLLHVLMPWGQHFSRRDPCGCGRCRKGPPPPGRREYVLDRAGQLRWCA